MVSSDQRRINVSLALLGLGNCTFPSRGMYCAGLKRWPSRVSHRCSEGSIGVAGLKCEKRTGSRRETQRRHHKTVAVMLKAKKVKTLLSKACPLGLARNCP